MKSSLLEVWGDTVDSRHLCGAIALGLTIAGSLYLAADEIMPSLVDDRTLAHSYALLVGLIGCLVAAVIAAKLFPPKREVVLGTGTDSAGRRIAMDAIEDEVGPLGDPRELPTAVQDELKALAVFDDLLGQHERNEAREAAGTSASTAPDTKETSA